MGLGYGVVGLGFVAAGGRDGVREDAGGAESAGGVGAGEHGQGEGQ